MTFQKCSLINVVLAFLKIKDYILYKKEIFQEEFEASVGAQFSPEFNLNETRFSELPSRRKDSKKKSLMYLLAKLKNLPELCYNIIVKEKWTLDDITHLVDETKSLARKKLETESEALVEGNIETTQA